MSSTRNEVIIYPYTFYIKNYSYIINFYNLTYFIFYIDMFK